MCLMASLWCELYEISSIDTSIERTLDIGTWLGRPNFRAKNNFLAPNMIIPHTVVHRWPPSSHRPSVDKTMHCVRSHFVLAINGTDANATNKKVIPRTGISLYVSFGFHERNRLPSYIYWKTSLKLTDCRRRRCRQSHSFGVVSLP